jgi:predicted RNA methylase
LETYKDISHKKFLGQYFSGAKVAKFLLTLSGNSGASKVIDPFCGSGDMLVAAAAQNAQILQLVGIEIDESVAEIANERSPRDKAKIYCRNSFDLDVVSVFDESLFDLVITNPPYIRYQNANKKILDSSLSVEEVRANLTRIVSESKALSSDEKDIYGVIIRNYSGLSDLAVPSWILCSLLVKKGGKIAMVLPASWLNRNYALIVEYLLLRFFKIDFLIEDAHATWFDGAQVNTILLVATRITLNKSILDWKNESYCFASVLSESIISEQDDQLKQVVKHIQGHENIPGKLINQKILIADMAHRVRCQAYDKKWYQKLEGQTENLQQNFVHKEMSELASWLKTAAVNFGNLASIGINIGQGLRTGANPFFYLQVCLKEKNNSRIKPSPIFELEDIDIDNGFLEPVIQRQSELNDSYGTRASDLNGAVLTIKKHFLTEDWQSLPEHLKDTFVVMAPELARYVNKAALTPGGNAGNLIPTLSAVKTNVRFYDRKTMLPPRYWYMLPPFAKRHRPDLFLPRVNGTAIKTRINIESALVDANFNTFWFKDKNSHYDPFGLLALLNSTYALVAMEEHGTVMGGGALKLEATQLKNIPFPLLSKKRIENLNILGKELLQTNLDEAGVLSRIDDVIIAGLNFKIAAKHKIHELHQIKDSLIKKRSRRNE